MEIKLYFAWKFESFAITEFYLLKKKKPMDFIIDHIN